MKARDLAKKRTISGQALAEFGPALILLILGFFIPMMDLIGDGISYGCCALLNGLQCHEASLVPWNEALDATGAVRKGIPDSWRKSGIGAFAQAEQDPNTVVTYRAGETDGNGAVDRIVNVQTTVTCHPFLPVPWIAAVPGLSAPVTFVLASEKAMENPDHGKP